MSATLIKPVDEAIKTVEALQAQAHEAALLPTVKVREIAQSRISGGNSNVTILGDISTACWTANHNWAYADEKSWTITMNGENPLKKGYELVVSLRRASAPYGFDTVREQRFEAGKFVDVVFDVNVEIRRSKMRRIQGVLLRRSSEPTVRVFGVTCLKGFWK